jgi:hypothetical protein
MHFPPCLGEAPGAATSAFRPPEHRCAIIALPPPLLHGEPRRQTTPSSSKQPELLLTTYFFAGSLPRPPPTPVRQWALPPLLPHHPSASSLRPPCPIGARYFREHLHEVFLRLWPSMAWRQPCSTSAKLTLWSAGTGPAPLGPPRGPLDQAAPVLYSHATTSCWSGQAGWPCQCKSDCALNFDPESRIQN